MQRHPRRQVAHPTLVHRPRANRRPPEAGFLPKTLDAARNGYRPPESDGFQRLTRPSRARLWSVFHPWYRRCRSLMTPCRSAPVNVRKHRIGHVGLIRRYPERRAKTVAEDTRSRLARIQLVSCLPCQRPRFLEQAIRLLSAMPSGVNARSDAMGNNPVRRLPERSTSFRIRSISHCSSRHLGSNRY